MRATVPLTFERVVETSGDTLYVIFDFDCDGWDEQIHALKEYWVAWAEGSSVQRVSFLSTDDEGCLEHPELENGNFVVYGLFAPKPNHLVFASFSDTPFDSWEEERQYLIERGMGDIGFAAVGCNPIGEGFVVAFNASSPAILADMMECLHLNCTCISVLKGEVINVGIFNYNFTPLIFSAKEAQADADYFFATLEKVHPLPLRYIGAYDYLALKKTVRTQLQQQEALHGHISYARLAGILAEAAARFKDGHTEIKPTSLLIVGADPDVLMLPFRLKLHCDRLIVESAIPELEDLCGKTLEAIDNRPIDEILRPALRRISGESENFRLAQFLDDQRCYVAWCALFRVSPVTMLFSDRKWNFTRTIDLISLQQYDDLLPEMEETRSFRRFLYDDRTCYYLCGSFHDTEHVRPYIARLFGEIREKGTERLIIDVRNNRGGSSDLVVYLLEFLTDKPFRMWSRVDIKLSDLLFQQRKEYAPFRHLAGLTVSESDEPETPGHREDLFRGELYVLIGPGTFSAAAEFAAVVKNQKLGKLIGEETGGRRQSTGDAVLDYLPSSAIMCRVSSMVYHASCPTVEDDAYGTVPDVSLDEEDLIKYDPTDDPLLHFVLEQFR